MRHAGFVRNVLVGRQGLTTGLLLASATEAGATNPKNYITTGNLTFDAQPGEIPSIRRRLGASISAIVGHSEEVFIRSIPNLQSLADLNPFEGSPVAEVLDRYVSFVDESSGDPELPINSRRGDICVFAATSREVFSVTTLIDGRASGPGPFVERIVGHRITTRNWNTIERILRTPT